MRHPLLAGWLVVAALVVVVLGASAAEVLSPSEAGRHVGESAQVCGPVVSSNYALRSRGQPTFLNFGKPFPNREFTALIWGSARPAFRYAPESLLGQTVCVRGVITTYQGKAQIVVSDPSQIERASDERERRQ